MTNDHTKPALYRRGTGGREERGRKGEGGREGREARTGWPADTTGRSPGKERANNRFVNGYREQDAGRSLEAGSCCPPG